MERSQDWARLEAGLRVVGELEHPNDEPEETTPDQLKAFLVDADGAPVVSEQRRDAFNANRVEGQQAKAAGSGGGNTFRDASGRALTAQQVSQMRDGKGRPIVLPR